MNNNNTKQAGVDIRTLDRVHRTRVELDKDRADLREAIYWNHPVYMAGRYIDELGAIHAADILAATVQTLEVLQGFAYGEDHQHLARIAKCAAASLSKFADDVERFFAPTNTER